MNNDTNDCWSHILQPILLFNIRANAHNKHLGIITIIQANTIYGIASEQYRSHKEKATDIQALNKRIFYNLIWQKIIPAIIVFAELFLKYDLGVHIIVALSPQRVNVPKDTILCTFMTLQNMSHSVRTAFGDSISTYRGDKCAEYGILGNINPLRW